MCKVRNPKSRTGSSFYARHAWKRALVDGYRREQCKRCSKLNPVDIPAKIRFWDHVDKTSSRNECWLWRGRKDESGTGKHRRARYGRFTIPGARNMMAHRYAWELRNGKIPKGMEIDHLCGITACVNPDHLEAVTRRENLRRAIGHRWGTCKQGHKIKGDNIYEYTSNGRKKRRCFRCLFGRPNNGMRRRTRLD